MKIAILKHRLIYLRLFTICRIKPTLLKYSAAEARYLHPMDVHYLLTGIRGGGGGEGKHFVPPHRLDPHKKRPFLG
jgi:hypothetical protein